MEIRQLRYLTVVARTLNFTRAAELLHVSQPPLSRQIAALERELGVELFHRNSRQVGLTPAGERLVEQAQRILDETDTMASLAEAARSGHAMAPLRLGVLHSTLVDLVPRLFEQLRDLPARPHLQLVCQEAAEIQHGLLEGSLDVVIGRSFSTDPRIETVMVRHESVVLALHEHDPLATHPEVELADIATAPLVLPPRSSAPEFVDGIISACRGVGFSPHIVHENADYQVLLGYVAAGVGSALVPESLTGLTVPRVVYRRIVRPRLPSDVFLAQSTEHPSPWFGRLGQLLQRAVEEPGHPQTTALADG